MSFSALVAPGNIRSSSQRSSRNGATIDHFILHHSAAFDVNQVLTEMQTASKQVSANYVVANDGTAYGVVDEEDRAWTSGSSTDGGKGAAWDRRSITFEILDQTGAPSWQISPAAQATVAAIIADVCKRRGITPQRAGDDHGWTVYGHRELYTIYAASYATACPGGLPLDAVTVAAAALMNPTQGDQPVLRYQINNPAGHPWIGHDFFIEPSGAVTHSASPDQSGGITYRHFGEGTPAANVPIQAHVSVSDMSLVLAELGIAVDASTVAPGATVQAPKAAGLTDAQLATIGAAVKVPTVDQFQALVAAVAKISTPTASGSSQSVLDAIAGIPAAVVKAEGAALANG